MVSDSEWHHQLRIWDAVKVVDDPKNRFAVYTLPNIGKVLLPKVRLVPESRRLDELRAIARQFALPAPVVGE
jgi:hypothetical protein